MPESLGHLPGPTKAAAVSYSQGVFVSSLRYNPLRGMLSNWRLGSRVMESMKPDISGSIGTACCCQLEE